MQNKKYKNLVFDVGQVLVEYRWQEMLMEHGLSKEEALAIGEEIFDDEIWAKGLDMGIYSLEEAIFELGKKYPKHKEVIAWFIRNGEQMSVPRPEVWEKITEFKKKGYGIYILSNYSQELFDAHTKNAEFLNVLDGGVISYQVHKVKPNPEIYQALFEECQLNPKDCYFFDDRPENVEAAQKLGMDGEIVVSREEINAKLSELLGGA